MLREKRMSSLAYTHAVVVAHDAWIDWRDAQAYQKSREAGLHAEMYLAMDAAFGADWQVTGAATAMILAWNQEYFGKEMFPDEN